MVKHYRKTNWVYCVSLILDPRHKLETFDLTDWGQNLKEMAYEKFVEILKNDYQDSNFDKKPDLTGKKKQKVIEVDEYTVDFNSIYLKKKDSEFSLETEINDYLKVSRVDISTNILQWWKNHEKSYPRISKMARDILSIQATSCPVERLFSSAALIQTQKRTCLSDESLKGLICLHSWMKSSLRKEIGNIDL